MARDPEGAGMTTMSQPTVTISKTVLALHMYSHAAAIQDIAYEKVAAVVTARKAGLEKNVGERTIFLREPKDADADDKMALIDALEEASWQGVQFGTALWAVEFEQDVEAVHFALRFDQWIVKAT